MVHFCTNATSELKNFLVSTTSLCCFVVLNEAAPRAFDTTAATSLQLRASPSCAGRKTVPQTRMLASLLRSQVRSLCGATTIVQQLQLWVMDVRALGDLVCVWCPNPPRGTRLQVQRTKAERWNGHRACFSQVQRAHTNELVRANQESPPRPLHTGWLVPGEVNLVVAKRVGWPPCQLSFGCVA